MPALTNNTLPQRTYRTCRLVWYRHNNLVDAAVQDGTCSLVRSSTWTQLTPPPIHPLPIRSLNLLYQTWTRKDLRLDLKEARAQHLHRCPPSRAFWRCLESLHDQTAPGLRRRTVLIPPSPARTGHLESSQVFADSTLPLTRPSPTHTTTRSTACKFSRTTPS